MYPPTGFRFSILFKGIDDPLPDSLFNSIAGLEANTDRPTPGPDSESVLSYDKTVYPVLVLKRAARKYGESALLRWLFAGFKKTAANPLPEAKIELLDETGQVAMFWTIRNIFPKSWKLSELNAEKSEILMETIEVYYEELSMNS